MVSGEYVLAVSMIEGNERMEVISNNIANSTTDGYKADTVKFSEVFSTFIQDIHSAGPYKYGIDVETDFSYGPRVETQNQFDMFINGKGFFTVLTSDGPMYTRNGSFSINNEGILVNKEGYPVLGESYLTNGVGIFDLSEIISEGNLTVSSDGELFIGEELIDKLLISDFPEPYDLNKIGNNLYKPGDQSKNKVFQAEYANIEQGALEGSNVTIAKEMVNLISCYRFYETSQRCISIQDTTVGKCINEVGRV